jgi:Protein of unknown function (DUF2934)
MPANKNFSPAKKAPVAQPQVVKTTPARNTPIPKAMPKMVSHEMVAKRAYEIFLSGKGGDQMHNWLQAERELKS